MDSLGFWVDVRAEKEWGTFELESATGKNSTWEAFGHKRASDFSKLENHQ